MATALSPAPVPFYGAVHSDRFEGADAVLFGAPHGTPYPRIDNAPFAGAPGALRATLQDEAGWTDHWDYDLDGPLFDDTAFDFRDVGNLATSSQDGAGNRAIIAATAADIQSAGAVPVMIGGDDSVPIPFIEGLAEAGPLTIVQVDAHIDWRDERSGEQFGFSSTMRRASEMAHVERIIQVGMRGLGSARREEVGFARDWGANIIPARQIHADGIGTVMDHIPAGAHCLITIDCDALDAGIMPAVMAPTPGGLSYTQVIDLVAAIAGHARIVAFDMIEFVPERDSNGIAAITAARIIVNLIGHLVRNRGTS